MKTDPCFITIPITPIATCHWRTAAWRVEAKRNVCDKISEQINDQVMKRMWAEQYCCELSADLVNFDIFFSNCFTSFGFPCQFVLLCPLFSRVCSLVHNTERLQPPGTISEDSKGVSKGSVLCTVYRSQSSSVSEIKKTAEGEVKQGQTEVRATKLLLHKCGGSTKKKKWGGNAYTHTPTCTHIQCLCVQL